MTILAVSLFCLLFCTKWEDVSTLDRDYTYAIIEMPNGEIIEGPVSDRGVYSNDLIDVTINGVKYMTHSENVIFMREMEEAK